MNYRLLIFAFVTLFAGLSLTMAAAKAESLLWAGVFGIVTWCSYMSLLIRSFQPKDKS